MIKRLEQKMKTIEQENEFSSYLEHFSVINQKDDEEESPQNKPKGKENYFCTLCKINFLKNDESLALHLKSKVNFLH